MTFDPKMSDKTDQNELLSILFVTSGTRGDRLLFKYPLDTQFRKASGKGRPKNPYAVQVSEDFKGLKLSDVTLANFLGVKSVLCGQKFNDLRFVGFPLLLEEGPDKSGAGNKSGHKILSFNIMFVLQASFGPWVVSCYQDLAQQITVALRHEERRCQYLSTQAKVMTTVHDEGLAHFYVNNWIEVNFCLPYKLHYLQAGYKPSKKEALLDSLPIDCTPALARLIQVASPVRSLQTLALEADLSLFQVFQLVCHLVYWAKAVIIYPLCETNIYALSPNANTHVLSKLVDEFTQQFPGRSLPVQLAEFSFPTTLRETQTAIRMPGSTDLMVQIVIWMLQHHLLIQLHTYIFFVPPVKARGRKGWAEEAPRIPELQDRSVIEGGLQRSPSFSDAASVTSDESITLSTPGMLVAQMSKSPSTEFTVDGSTSLLSEESKAYWLMQESVFSDLSMEEKDCILKVPAAKNLDDLRMFARLFPYFCGKSHIEEVMYFENLRRSQLITLIEKFKEVLILCTYKDPVS
ncbi:NPRL3-like protein [Mya arenaria]|uniref:GATOR complex protein NPRL3 n=1 Tax=Mya arenaria TaxID=6604 RepID=A0ABY7DKL5_MYAAR|nr:NPRL3-like protein [Mya arenaria]